MTNNSKVRTLIRKILRPIDFLINDGFIWVLIVLVLLGLYHFIYVDMKYYNLVRDIPIFNLDENINADDGRLGISISDDTDPDVKSAELESPDELGGNSTNESDNQSESVQTQPYSSDWLNSYIRQRATTTPVPYMTPTPFVTPTPYQTTAPYSTPTPFSSGSPTPIPTSFVRVPSMSGDADSDGDGYSDGDGDNGGEEDSDSEESILIVTI